MAERWRRWGLWLALAALLLLALGLRLYRLDAQSLWNDEGTSVALAGRDLATITRSAALDIHPPFYYYVLHAWTRLFGDGEAAVRSLSALAGAGVVAVTWALGWRLFGPAAGLLAGLYAGTSAFQVYYSQEARMYILVTLLGGLSMLAFVRLLEAWSGGAARRRALIAASVAYVLATALATYTHYFAFSLLAGQNVAVWIWLLGRRGAERRVPWGPLLAWGALQALVVALYVPWLVASWGSLRSWPAVSAPLSLGGLLARATQVFAFGVTIADTRTTRLLAATVSAPAIAALAAGVGAWRRRLRDLTPGGTSALGTAIAALYAAAPVLVMYGLSLSRPMYKPKFLLLATPGYHVLLAAGALALAGWLARAARRAWLRPLVTVILAGAVLAASAWSLTALYSDPRTYRDDYRGIVQYIEATAGPQDAILINAPGQVETVGYYYHGPLPMVPLPLQRPIDAEATRAALDELLAKQQRIYAILWATDESDPEGVIEGYLDQHAFKTLDSWFGDVRLAVYAVPEAPPTAPQQATEVTFGESIRLRGYSLGARQVASGDIVQLALFWECLQPVREPLKVFTHLVDARGNIIGQRDSEPAGGSRPTLGWAVGETIVDYYGLLVRPGTPPGPHTVRIGLYSAADGHRLAVSAAGQPLGDALDLDTVTVVAPSTPPPAGALDVQHRDSIAWDGVALLGHNLHRLGAEHEVDLVLHRGDAASLVLFWQRQEGAAPGDAWVASLRDRRGRTVWDQALRIAGGDWPPAQWEPGEIVRDAHVLSLPAEVSPGTYGLYLAPEAEPGRAHRLQRVEILP